MWNNLNVIFANLGKFNFRSVYLNFKYLPFSKAIYLPIFISRNCSLTKTDGKIKINSKLSPGMIQIGYELVGIFNSKSRSIIELRGEIIFNGKTRIGQGCKLIVFSDSKLELGENFGMTAESTIICYKGIKIGDDCLLSWDVLIMDTDFHKIFDELNFEINQPKEISIGDRVWIGCRSLILKGVVIPSGNIIAANTTITKSLIGYNSVVGGNPTKTLKQNISWKL